jgi:hypothetical protein
MQSPSPPPPPSTPRTVIPRKCICQALCRLGGCNASSACFPQIVQSVLSLRLPLLILGGATRRRFRSTTIESCEIKMRKKLNEKELLDTTWLQISNDSSALAAMWGACAVPLMRTSKQNPCLGQTMNKRITKRSAISNFRHTYMMEPDGPCTSMARGASWLDDRRSEAQLTRPARETNSYFLSAHNLRSKFVSHPSG